MKFIQSVISTSGARLAFLETEISRLWDRLEQSEEELFVQIPHWEAVAVSTPSLWSLFVMVWSRKAAYLLPLAKL
ncbi:hypothetical protein DFH09DRAFT_1326713 [Mycena vulgaris]|nr:hypothetical protein DFH09DRAFT_1326713 [Mycena vulgaris]